MTIVIIDDETKARSLLIALIKKQIDSEHEVFEASNLVDGVELIKKEQPKLVFLDIEMPNHQGIEIFNYFQPNEITFEIVFTTAYSEYALKAFELNAIDYLLKPIRPARIKEVIEKVEKTFNQEKIQIKLDELSKSLRENNFNKIGLPVADGILFVPFDEIVNLEASGMYTKIFTVNSGEEIISKPLKYFENLLDQGNTFYRTHRSHIVNLKFLKQYVRKDGNFVIMENNEKVPVSKEKKDEFLTLVSNLG